MATNEFSLSSDPEPEPASNSVLQNVLRELEHHRELMKVQHEALTTLLHEKHANLDRQLSGLANQFVFEEEDATILAEQPKDEAEVAAANPCRASHGSTNAVPVAPPQDSPQTGASGNNNQDPTMACAATRANNLILSLPMMLGSGGGRVRSLLGMSVQTSRLQQAFEAVMGLLIIVNCVLMFVQLQLSGYIAGATLPIEKDFGSREWDRVVWNSRGHSTDFTPYVEACETTQNFFNFVFLIELAVRIVWFRRKFFTLANIGDGVIVILSALNSVAHQIGDLSFLRMFRGLRIFRALKVVRVVTYFRQLRVLVGTIYSSFLSFTWSMIIMMLMMLISALCKTQLLQHAVSDESFPLELREWLYVHYGTCSRAMFTMFRATFSGCWPGYATRVIEEVDYSWSIFWIAYAAFVVFAIIRIISALFLRDTLASAASDVNVMIEDQLKTKAAYMRKLHDLLEEVDQDGDGTISFEEFEHIMQQPRTKAWLAVLEISGIDDNALWKLLETDSDGVITRDEFVGGIMSIKGHARAHDMSLLRRETEQILAMVTKLGMECNEIREEVRKVSTKPKLRLSYAGEAKGPLLKGTLTL